MNEEPNKRYGVIDIGTNSARLLIFEKTSEGGIKRLNKSVQYTRMGQDVDKTGRLHEDAMKRNFEALAAYQAIARDYGVTEIYCFGTSAMRDAANSDAFITDVREKLGLTVSVISGETEAAYGFCGVSKCFETPILIVDIGGGSTELILGEGATRLCEKSLNVGCVRMTEKHIHGDPPAKSDLAAIEKEVATLLDATLPAFGDLSGKTLVGIGGTATTMVTMAQKMTVYDGSRVHQSRITLETLTALLEQLAAMPQRQRQSVPGLDPKRADIILAGMCILQQVMRKTGLDEMTICDYDNLEGAAAIAFE